MYLRKACRTVSKEQICDFLFVCILILYPMRHVTWGLDLWDTGYNYGNFLFAEPEHMGVMWFFSTYLANMVGSALTHLPFGQTLIGLNVYTGLFTTFVAVGAYLFCVKVLRIPRILAMAGEFLAVSMCWCPTALLYNYLTYVLFFGGFAFLYMGLTGERNGYLFIAGVLLGTNVFVRFSNLPEAVLILAVWAYDLMDYWESKELPEGKGKGFWKPTLKHTGWCVLGYIAAVGTLLLWIQIRYGLTAYLEGISQLFAMTEQAKDYRADSMIRGIVIALLDESYWVFQMVKVILFGMVVFGVLKNACYYIRRTVAGGSGEKTVNLVLNGILGAAMLYWVYRCGKLLYWLHQYHYFDLEYFHYGAIVHPGGLFLVLALVIGVIRILAPGCEKEEKLLAGLVILVVVFTSIGSNNHLFPSMNNMFVVAPYVLWECGKFFGKQDVKCLAGKVMIPLIPIKGVLLAILLLCSYQFIMFGMDFQFAEGTGVQNIGYRVDNNDTLAGVIMSEEKAEWMSELSAYAKENNFEGKEVILYGDIPALSFYLKMPAAFHAWCDLDSFSYSIMVKRLEEKGDCAPIIILENRYAVLMQEGSRGLAGLEISQREKELMAEDKKWVLLETFMNQRGYRNTFRNEKFGVYQIAEQ